LDCFHFYVNFPKVLIIPICLSCSTWFHCFDLAISIPPMPSLIALSWDSIWRCSCHSLNTNNSLNQVLQGLVEIYAWFFHNILLIYFQNWFITFSPTPSCSINHAKDCKVRFRFLSMFGMIFRTNLFFSLFFSFHPCQTWLSL
jgi:hypothetical protein